MAGKRGNGSKTWRGPKVLRWSPVVVSFDPSRIVAKSDRPVPVQAR